MLQWTCPKCRHTVSCSPSAYRCLERAGACQGCRLAETYYSVDWDKLDWGVANHRRLKPCPFCGKEGPALAKPPEHESYVYWCTNCGCFGPNELSERGAAKMWNLRRAHVNHCDGCGAMDLQDRWYDSEDASCICPNCQHREV